MAFRKNNGENPRNDEKVIDQLFGTEEETDIESDIAELGAQPDEFNGEKPVKQKRFFFIFAIFVIIMAIIGCISTVNFIANLTAQLVDNTSLKNEFARFIFPVVVNDIAPFENVSEIPNTSKITCSIWNIIVNRKTEQYEGDSGVLTIPEYDVMASCKELFGTTASIEHETVGTAEMRFTYDAEKHSYTASKNIRYLTYAPYVVDITESDGNYVLIVGYLPPTVATVTGISGMEASPEKYMEYTINRWDGKDTLMSVRFSDYTPETVD